MNIIKYKNYFFILGLLALVLLYFFPLLDLTHIPYSGDMPGSDLTEINLPLRHLMKSALNQGQLPLWAEMLSSGYPLLAESEIGFFYPLHFLMFKSLPFLVAFNYSFIVHWFLGALFVYLFARQIKISPQASFLAAISFIFSSFFVGHLKHVNMVEAAIWMPLIMLLIELFFRKKQFIFLFFVSLILTIQILVGHFQISYYTILLAGIYFIWRLSSPDQRAIKFKTKSLWFLVFIGCIILSFLIAAIQILPTKELVFQSWRQNGLTVKTATECSYHPKNIISFIFPFFYGNPASATYLGNFNEDNLLWEKFGYIGLVPLALALLSFWLLFKKKNINIYSIFFTIISVLCLVFLLGSSGYLFELFWRFLPGFSFFRAHARVLLILIFSLSILSAYGFDWLIKTVKSSKSCSHLKPFTTIIAVLIIAISIFDLFYFNYQYNTYIGSSKWMATPESVDFIGQDQSYFRIHSFANAYSSLSFYYQAGGWLKNKYFLINNRNVLEPNSQSLYGLSSIEDLISLKIKRHCRFDYILNWINPITDSGLIDFPKENKFDLSDRYLKLVGMQNGKYILSYFNLNNPSLEKVHQVNFDQLMMPLNIYYNKYWLPRSYFVRNIKIVPTDDSVIRDLQVIKSMIDPGFDFGNTAVVEKEINLKPSDGQSSVAIDSWAGSHISLSASTDSENFLVISNTFYPGWQAYIDDKPVEIYRANYLYQGVIVEPGKHKIEFIYRPKSFVLGKKISLISLTFVIIFLINYAIIRLKFKKNN